VWVAAVGEIHFYNGTAWSTSTVGAGYRIEDISMISPTDGWAVSSNNQIHHYNGFAWVLWYDFGVNFVSMKGIWAANSSNIWAVSTASIYADNVRHWDGSTWTSFDRSYHIYDVESNSDTDVWFAGRYGRIDYWNGIEFSQMNSPTTEDIRKIHFLDSSDGWAVGDGGVILRYR